MNWLYAIVQAGFILFKVAGIISWSWWSVFIPTYIGIGIPLVVIVGSVGLAGLICLVEKVKDKWQKREEKLQ